MKLYLVNGSPNCRKVLSVINHLGINPEIVWLDFFEGDLQGPEFLAVNPNGLVPALEDNGFFLWESNAINVYAASTLDNTLYPNDPQVRADIQRWLSWDLAHYNKALSVVAFQAVAKPQFGLGDTDEHLVKVFSEDFYKFAGILEKHLEGRDFMVGDDWTLADYSIGHVEPFVGAVPLDFEKYPNVSAFYERLRNNSYWSDTEPKSPEEMGRVPVAAK